MPDTKRRIIAGVCGAAAIAYAARALDVLRSIDVETHLIMSKPAELMRALESDLSREDPEGMADVIHHIRDVGATIASGSFDTMGMLIAPCSMRSLAEIAPALRLHS